MRFAGEVVVKKRQIYIFSERVLKWFRTIYQDGVWHEYTMEAVFMELDRLHPLICRQDREALCRYSAVLRIAVHYLLFAGGTADDIDELCTYLSRDAAKLQCLAILGGRKKNKVCADEFTRLWYATLEKLR